MKIGGWKTRSVFERYAIVSHSDIEDALQKLEQPKEALYAEARQGSKPTREWQTSPCSCVVAASLI
jgi:hypothetical protein